MLNQLKNKKKYAIIASFKLKQMGKLINRIPGSRLLLSTLPGSALRTDVDRSASLAISTSVLKALPGKLEFKRRSPSILYISFQLTSYRYFITKKVKYIWDQEAGEFLKLR